MHHLIFSICFFFSIDGNATTWRINHGWSSSRAQHWSTFSTVAPKMGIFESNFFCSGCTSYSIIRTLRRHAFHIILHPFLSHRLMDSNHSFNVFKFSTPRRWADASRFKIGWFLEKALSARTEEKKIDKTFGSTTLTKTLFWAAARPTRVEILVS